MAAKPDPALPGLLKVLSRGELLGGSICENLEWGPIRPLKLFSGKVRKVIRRATSELDYLMSGRAQKLLRYFADPHLLGGVDSFIKPVTSEPYI